MTLLLYISLFLAISLVSFGAYSWIASVYIERQKLKKIRLVLALDRDEAQRWHYILQERLRHYCMLGSVSQKTMTFITINSIILCPIIFYYISKQMVFIGIVIGCAVPFLYLQHKIAHRNHNIDTAMPDFLDLVLLCLQAGLPLFSAFERATTEIIKLHPILGKELQQTINRMQIQIDQNEGLLTLKARTRSILLHHFIALLLQAQRYGTSLTKSLEDFTAHTRESALMAAEEKAQRLPSLLTLPLVLCFLPALLIMILGPSFLKIIDMFDNFG
jgi:pilus assembly protein TadC